MRALTTIPQKHPAIRRPPTALRRGLHRVRAILPGGERPNYPSLIDAKTASEILNVPVSWLLSKARAGRIPHHRLGHYVRFSDEDLRQLTEQTRIVPDGRR